MKSVFERIINNKEWTQHICGPGSTIEYTENLRKNLNEFLLKYKITSFLDIPCGDYSWMNLITLSPSIRYIGADVVDSLIDQNQKNYPSIDFRVLDITKDKLPAVDLLFCRDCFLHLSFTDLHLALTNISNSEIKYVLMSNWNNNKRNYDDIETGGSRIINFLEPPFEFTNPIDSIIDFIPGYPKRSLMLWPKSTIDNYLRSKNNEKKI